MQKNASENWKNNVTKHQKTHDAPGNDNKRQFCSVDQYLNTDFHFEGHQQQLSHALFIKKYVSSFTFAHFAERIVHLNPNLFARPYNALFSELQ